MIKILAIFAFLSIFDCSGNQPPRPQPTKKHINETSAPFLDSRCMTDPTFITNELNIKHCANVRW